MTAKTLADISAGGAPAVDVARLVRRLGQLQAKHHGSVFLSIAERWLILVLVALQEDLPVHIRNEAVRMVGELRQREKLPGVSVTKEDSQERDRSAAHGAAKRSEESEESEDQDTAETSSSEPWPEAMSSSSVDGKWAPVVPPPTSLFPEEPGQVMPPVRIADEPLTPYQRRFLLGEDL